jgi:hypothetical protein
MKLPATDGAFLLARLALLGFLACLGSCGGGSGASGQVHTPQAIRIDVSPRSAAVVPGATRQFAATVRHAQHSDVTWSVNGKDGGNAEVGTISSSGVYRAPGAVPSPDVVTVRATSRQDVSKTASATVKILTVCSASDDAMSQSSPAQSVVAPERFVSLPASSGLATPAGSDHAIAPQTVSYDCSTNAPGDMLTLVDGTRDPLSIRNCNGTASNPITIRNDPNGIGPTIIRRASEPGGGFIFSCEDCIGVVIDGSYKWRGAPEGPTYGIKVTMTSGEGPSAFLRIGGKSRFVTIRNVEVDGAWPQVAQNGIGISVNDHSILRSDYPGLWREGILIEHNYVHDVEGEGMYIGGGYKYGNLLSRNIEIRYNRVEDTGWGAIDMKSAVAGDNSIHHNVVRRAGKNTDSTNKSSQYSGITNLSGTAKIYNNWIETTGQHGITSWTAEGPKESEGYGPFEARIWNNVIVDAGALWRSYMSHSYGINVGAQDGCEKPAPYVYNNTIVNSRESAVNLTSNVGTGLVSDNIIADAGGTAIKAPSSVKLSNNRVGSASQMGFVRPEQMDFRLRLDSAARNHGESLRAQTDFDDVARPQDGAPDQGAFEHTTGSVNAAPMAPTSLVVE